MLYVLDLCVACTGLMFVYTGLMQSMYRLVCCMNTCFTSVQYNTSVQYMQQTSSVSANSMGMYILNPEDALRYAEYVRTLVERERGWGMWGFHAKKKRNKRMMAYLVPRPIAIQNVGLFVYGFLSICSKWDTPHNFHSCDSVTQAIIGNDTSINWGRRDI